MRSKNVTVYIDMDGVLAIWDPTCSVEETFEPGYFISRRPEPSVIEMIEKLNESGMKVVILTAVYTEGPARDEKKAWLLRYGIQNEVIMVPYGKKKKDYVRTDGLNILLDDYSKNLHEWEVPDHSCKYIGIKFLNGINGNNRTWNGYTVDSRMTGDKIAKTILGIACIES